MSEIGFPLKDLTRRKQQTTLTFVGLTITLSATVFLILFGTNLGFEISLFTQSNQLTSGFNSIFSQFILTVLILNILTGLIVTSFLVYLIMSTRMKDIGIMKASGCLENSVFSYFFTEISLIVIFSTLIGTCLGIISYYCSTFFLNVTGFSISQNLNIAAIILVGGISIIFSHFFGALPLKKAAKAKPLDAMSSTYQQESNVSVGENFPSKLGFCLKVVYRNLVRRQSSTIQAIICLTAVFTLITVIIAGGLIANETTLSYVERAIGKNVVILGHSTVTGRYVDLLSELFESKPVEQLDYLDSKYAISEQFVGKLETIHGVTAVDARLILETQVREGLGVVLDPIEKSEAILIGGNRTNDALVLGIHPERVVNDWLFYGKKVGVNDQNVAMIGDSLASNMFDDATNQRIRVFEQSKVPYDVIGVCVDPLNNGKVVYIPLKTMYNDTGKNGYNLVFLKLDYLVNPQVLQQITEIVSNENLDVVELDFVLNNHTRFLNNIWSLVMFLPLFTVVTAVIALFSYLNLMITGQQHEFGVMKALGAKQKTVSKIIFCHATIIILISGLIGIFGGLFITIGFLFPDPVISHLTVISVFILLVSILGLLCVSSLYPALKAANKDVLDAIYSI
ncbi:MAG: FtsX-like permease family protein [Candidatus Bathyarchaeota archaeon]|nr:FtsX-like permease family protein [Candidatus Bathyarchaeum tardum]WNZ29169.1 MAG: FtsX-like permease family protein [Candidatus Bathyarchaeota archaeon]